MRNELVNKTIAIVTIGLLGLALLALAVWGIWEAALFVPPNVARVWALTTTALLPVTIFVTWRLATRYAVGVVHGIDAGIDKVAKAGRQAADLNIHVRQQTAKPTTPAIVLPQVEIIPRQLASGGQMINL